MKAALPIAQAEGIVAPNANQAPSKRQGAIADEFGSAFAEQILEREPKSKEPLRERPEQPPNHDHDTRHSEAAKQANEGFMRPDGRLLHRLREMHASPLEDVSDDAPNLPADPTPEVTSDPTAIVSVTAELPGDTNTAFVQNALNPKALHPSRKSIEFPTQDSALVQEGEEPRVDVMTMRPLGLPTSIDLGHSEPQRELKAHAPGSSVRETDYQGKRTALDLNAAANGIVSGTPVKVLDRQTHFSRDPIGRKESTAFEAADREATVRRPHPPQASIRGNEPRHVGLAHKNGDAGQLPKETADAPTPAAQLLSKLLEVYEEEKAPGKAPASSSTWLSTDRPFGSMMRLIRLELSPGSLGVVHVTLKGANAALSISIEAEQPQTAASLGADQSTLSSRLKEAGYAIDEIIVTTFDRSPDIAGPSRPDQTSGASSSAFADRADDLQRRNGDDGGRRQQPDPDRSPQSEAHGSERDGSRGIAEPQRAPSTAWRGRHMTRSV